MDTRGDGTVAVVLHLQQALYHRVISTARQEQRPAEEVIQALVAAALDGHENARVQWETLSDSYRARLAREGKLSQSTESVFAELAKTRDQVANDLIPD